MKQVQIEEQKKIVDKEKEECAQEESMAKAEKSQADAIQADCDMALNEVKPIVADAQAAVNALKPAHVTELKSFKTPSTSVAAVAKCLCIFFKVGANKIRGQTKNEATKEDYWAPAQKQVLNDKLLGKLQNYIRDNKDGAPDDVVEKIKPTLQLPEMNKKALDNAGAACSGIGTWCTSIIQFTEAMKIYNPKQE